MLMEKQSNEIWDENFKSNVVSGFQAVLWSCVLEETSIILKSFRLHVEHWKSLISLSVLHIWLLKVNTVCVCVCACGKQRMFVDMSVEDGSDINLNHITLLVLTVAHSSSLSTHTHTHTHINTHIFACTHPSFCAPTQRKYVGYKSKLYPVWVFSWCLWQLNRQGNNCKFSHIKLMARSGNAWKWISSYFEEDTHDAVSRSKYFPVLQFKFQNKELFHWI